MKKLVFTLPFALVLGFAPSVRATLINNSGNLFSDTDQNTVSYDPASAMTWNQTMAWASDLPNGGAAAGAWSLPTTPGTETGHHFYDELDSSAGGPPADTDHLTPGYFATGTEYAPSPDRSWWEFCIGECRNENNKDRYCFYKEPYEHNVGASAPIPGAVLLFAPGLLGLAVMRRRFRKWVIST